MTIETELVRKEELMDQNIHFERCVNFLARMIEKYGDELLLEEQEKVIQHEESVKPERPNDVA